MDKVMQKAVLNALASTMDEYDIDMETALSGKYDKSLIEFLTGYLKRFNPSEESLERFLDKAREFFNVQKTYQSKNALLVDSWLVEHDEAITGIHLLDYSYAIRDSLIDLVVKARALGK